MLCDDFPEMRGGAARDPKALGGSAVTLHLALPDVDAVFERAVAAGASVTMPLADQFWGDRYGKLRDPFGHEWSLATPKQPKSQAERDQGAEQYFGAKHSKP
jgi:PhnB protein